MTGDRIHPSNSAISLGIWREPRDLSRIHEYVSHEVPIDLRGYHEDSVGIRGFAGGDPVPV